ncbi:DNA translocase FtsK-like [Portunus trituberculatus]|uniref:DNA translocase FtsK-like n=1 Tax=Portunus trituberculatus TaxID=210409 RepID=UPI001E1CFFE6|nr:DNA translocase FtsK-like [Portunus trituberculatus]
MPKNAKQPAPQQELSPSLQEEGSGDVPADEVPDDTDVPDVEDVATVQAVAGPSMKRTRPSKKDVKDYPFTDDQLREIANFVQSHPELYDKREEVGGEEEDRLREDREEGEQEWISSQAEDAEEQKVVEVWGFLAGHIAHETTHPSEDFGRQWDDPESSSQESVLSAHSLARRKRKKERQEEDLSSPRSTRGSPERSAIQELLQSAQLLATRKPPLEGPVADVRQFVEFMYTRLMKVSPMHHGVLFAKINYMISLMEEPVMGRSAIKDPRRLLDAVPMPVGVPGPSQQWQPPAPPTVAPAPPPPPPPPVYHQPQYQQPHYAQPHYLQQQYQQPQQQHVPHQDQTPAPEDEVTGEEGHHVPHDRDAQGLRGGG